MEPQNTPEHAAADSAPQPTTAPSPVMDVVPPPPVDPASAPVEQTEQPQPEQHQPVKPKVPKHHGDGVTTAIVATIIIVLGLGLLAVYAFLKQP